MVRSRSTAPIGILPMIGSSSCFGGKLTVKAHPGDRTGLLPMMLREYPEVKLIKDGGSQEVICNSDLVIVVSSTTGLEACAAGKPLVLLRAPGVPSFVPYCVYGAALAIDVSRPDAATELANAIQGLQSDPNQVAALSAGRLLLLN